ncbi:MAG: EamA family transporter [Burkholderiales bacterium]
MEISLPVTLAVLGAALLHASWNVLVKAGADKELETINIALGSGLVALIAALFLPPPARASWPWVAASAVVHILYFIFLAGAYRWGELSYAYPVMRGGGPMLVALVGALALGEVLPLHEALGVLLVCAGILAFASGRHDRRATAFALANAVVIAAYTLIDGQGARASGAPASYTMWFFIANGVVILVYGLLRRGAAVGVYWRRHWLRSLIGGSCALGAYGIALWAMTRAPIAVVAVLRETAVIFGAFIAYFVLKEKLTRRRLAATGAVMLGLVALKL